MRLTVAVMTRNKSIYVTCLHMLLQLTAMCIQTNHQMNIVFVNDTSGLQKLIKSSERLLWVDYGACLDNESFPKIFEKMEVVVFPAVKEGINWVRFKENVENGSKEPVSQSALDFDTVVGKKVSDGMYVVESSVPSIWVMDTKCADKLRDKKGEGMNLPNSIEDVFKKFVAKDVKVHAYVKCNVLKHYSHECVGNILEAVGITCKQG